MQSLKCPGAQDTHVVYTVTGPSGSGTNLNANCKALLTVHLSSFVLSSPLTHAGVPAAIIGGKLQVNPFSNTVEITR